MENSKPDIYQFEDHCLFLGAILEWTKENDASFTYRKFSESAGIKNPAYIIDIIKAKRTMSEDFAMRAGKVLGLSQIEGEYLVLLNRHSRAKKVEDRDTIYREILNRRSHSKFARLHQNQFRFFEDPVYTLVFTGIQAMDFRGDFEKLAAFFNPSLTTDKVKKAIRNLCEWKLIRQEKSGRYITENAFIEPPATMNAITRRMNREWLQQLPTALENIPAKERHISTTVISISEKGRQKIQDKIEQLRREIAEILKNDSDANQVMQVTLALVPKSKKNIP